MDDGIWRGIFEILEKPKVLGYFNFMSRKTDNIRKSIDKLEELKGQLAICNSVEDLEKLQEIEFQMGQEIKNLRFWTESLYRYNGKSTSNAKKASSRENGKKGGRPPKVITDLRKRKLELENTIMPELESKKNSTIDFLEERCLSEEIDKCQHEIEEIDEKLSNYKR